MKLGIFAKTFAGAEPAVVLEASRKAGYAAVQYNMTCSGLQDMPEVIPADVAAAVRAASASHGVEISAVSATYNMAHPDPAVRKQGLSQLRAIASAAHAMGSRLLTLCTGTLDPRNMWRRHPDNDTPEAWRVLIESMTAAIAIADQFDVDLGVEPELANIVSSAERAKRLIDEMRSPRVRVILDAANLFELGSLERQRAIVASGIELLAGRISIAHAKDRQPDGRFTTAGLGVVDYPHFVRCLKQAKFDGPLITHGLTAEQAPQVARFLHALL